MTWVLVGEKHQGGRTALIREFCWNGEWPHFWVELFVTTQPPTAGLVAVQVSWQESDGAARNLTDSWPASLLPEVMAAVVKAQRLFKIEALKKGSPTPMGPFGNRDLALVVDLDTSDSGFPPLDQDSPLEDDYVLGRVREAMEDDIQLGGYQADDAVRERHPGQIVIYPAGTAWEEDEYVFVSVERRERWTRQERLWRQSLIQGVRNLTPLGQESVQRQITRLILQALHERQDQNDAGAV